MTVAEEVERIAGAAAAFADAGEELAGVLVAETLGRRVYLCAFESAEGHAGSLFGDDGGAARPSGDSCAEAASLAALCEVAEESAGGGHLPELRARLAELRETANPEGIEEAEAAAAALAETLQPEPRVASGDYLDALGSASRRLEQALGESGRLSLRGGDAGCARVGRGARRRRRAQLQARAGMSGELEKRASDAEREQAPHACATHRGHDDHRPRHHSEVELSGPFAASAPQACEPVQDGAGCCPLRPASASAGSGSSASWMWCAAKLDRMEGGGFGFPFGGDPEEIMRGLREFAEQQAESVQEAQREQFATLTLNTAVELTAAALQQIQPQGGVDEQAIALRDAMRVLFPEAVALVSAARQGFMRETP